MNGKPFVLFVMVLCLAIGFAGPGAGANPQAPLTVKNIAFSRAEIGREKVTLSCNHACVPELFSIEGDNPRVVMDMKGVSLVQAGVRNVDTGGNFVKRVRSYQDKKTNILRVVLDLEPAKYYMVHPIQDPSGKTYTLSIKDATDAPLSQEKRITIIRPNLRPEEQAGKQQEKAPSQGKYPAAPAEKETALMNLGKLQMNAGDFSSAVDTFTRILTANPRDSLSYRLRGNAHDSMGDRQKAVADWTQAARLGDTLLQSYLDFLKVQWRENPAPKTGL